MGEQLPTLPDQTLAGWYRHIERAEYRISAWARSPAEPKRWELTLAPWTDEQSLSQIERGQIIEWGVADGWTYKGFVQSLDGLVVTAQEQEHEHGGPLAVLWQLVRPAQNEWSNPHADAP